MAALSTSNVSKAGCGGGRQIIAGQWTASMGDGEATLAVAGSLLFGAQFMTFSADLGSEVPVKSVSVSGGVITITLATMEAVTAGTFHLIVGGGM